MRARPATPEAGEQPAALDDEAVLALYTRTHWLVVASFERTIAENEATAPPGGAGERWAYDTIRNLIPALRERLEEYQYQYKLAVRDGDTALMRRFLRNTRAARRGEPEFEFLPAL